MRNLSKLARAFSSCKAPQKELLKKKLFPSECAIGPYKLPSVVIVGAGVAGLSAARRLLQVGLTNVKVIEATDRPGGRVLTGWVGDTVIDLGATYVHKSITDSVYTLAKLEAPMEYRRSTERRKLNIYLTEDGGLLYNDIKLAEDVAKMLEKSIPQGAGSVKDFFAVRMPQELVDFPPFSRYEAELILSVFLNKIRCKWGADLSSLSAESYDCLTPIAGEEIRVSGGMIGAIAALMRDIPTIIYNKPVDKVSTRGSCCGRVQVLCCDGEIFDCDYAIVTIPLGVLRDNLNTFFDPPIPRVKREAIEKIGIGRLVKVFMEFPSPWVHGAEGTVYLTKSYEAMESNHWLGGVGWIEQVPGSSHLLSFTVGGSRADCIESCSEIEVAVDFTKMIRRYLANPDIPFPSSVVRTNWNSDEYFKGSISYNSMSTTPEQRDDLKMSLPMDARVPKVLFAGEATSKDYFGTLHGARKSGLEAAEEIINVTNYLKGCPKD